ncbi:RES family NAD+ phosphorylase [Roseibium sp. Sym1]|uniref:RES family NAD+ phosphorylase n=1 Tax=Roseibium sp. Sym1 TaxID=3016006 RepID=UPI0022B5A520|nr:RES family NAD+ phosphorylase [Roseibium sp. Sym1]
MIYDPELIEHIQSLPCERFDGQVFRTTGLKSDPTAFSTNGGRWAPPDGNNGGCSILYTSLERNGALAEVASYLSLLTPVPQKSLALHTLEVAPQKTLRLAIGDFSKLGIDASSYNKRNYEKTQLVGAVINFLELDGLIAPSARWNCANLMIFGDNYPLDAKLRIVSTEEISFEAWNTFGSD